MIQTFTPSLLMFIATVLVSGLLIMPALKVRINHDLARFYWRGFWLFLCIIAAFAGGQQILLLAGVDVSNASVFYLGGLTASYIIFVIFAWFRLTWVTLWGFGLNIVRRVKATK